MKTVVIYGVDFYQLCFSPILKLLLGTPRMCKFSLSCSEYTKQMIQKYGVWKGVQFGLIRIAKCL